MRVCPLARALTHRRDRNENGAQVALRQDGDRGRDREEDDEPYRACLNREDPRLNKKPNEACRKHQAAPEQLVCVCRSRERHAVVSTTQGKIIKIQPSERY